MAQSKILLDSNSYFRLAKSIQPLLFVEFGADKHCLYVLDDLQKEFDCNPRLQREFPWVDEEEYRNNRSRKLSLSRKDKREIQTAYDIIWDYVLSEPDIGASPVDTRILSHSYVLGIPTVTDDTDMRVVATTFDIKAMKTLELLVLMLECEHITMDRIRQIMAYWEYVGDKPTGCHKDYKRLFKESPP